MNSQDDNGCVTFCWALEVFSLNTVGPGMDSHKELGCERKQSWNNG